MYSRTTAASVSGPKRARSAALPGYPADESGLGPVADGGESSVNVGLEGPPFASAPADHRDGFANQHVEHNDLGAVVSKPPPEGLRAVGEDVGAIELCDDDVCMRCVPRNPRIQVPAYPLIECRPSPAIVLLSLAVLVVGCAASSAQTEPSDASTDGGADSRGGLPGTDGSDMDIVHAGDGGPSADGPSSRCPTSQSQAACSVAPGGLCLDDHPQLGCAPNALPMGLACAGEAQCTLEILPCAGEVQGSVGAGRVDGYICSCIEGHWSCDDCYAGQAPCAEAGALGDGGVEGRSVRKPIAAPHAASRQ